MRADIAVARCSGPSVSSCLAARISKFSDISAAWSNATCCKVSFTSAAGFEGALTIRRALSSGVHWRWVLWDSIALDVQHADLYAGRSIQGKVLAHLLLECGELKLGNALCVKRG